MPEARGGRAAGISLVNGSKILIMFALENVVFRDRTGRLIDDLLYDFSGKVL